MENSINPICCIGAVGDQALVSVSGKIRSLYVSDIIDQDKKKYDQRSCDVNITGDHSLHSRHEKKEDLLAESFFFTQDSFSIDKSLL